MALNSCTVHASSGLGWFAEYRSLREHPRRPCEVEHPNRDLQPVCSVSSQRLARTIPNNRSCSSL
jgi:hypothetical protein